MRSRPDRGSVKVFVAKRERNKGDNPYMTIEAPEAVPIKLGKFFVAANSSEKKLEVK